MSKTLLEYAEWLDGRELLWPSPPPAEPVKATPYLKPLPEVRGVVWSLYGTLLRIADGHLLHLHPQAMRMQVALEKTIQEFNMWNSMSRKPGAPWEYMLQQYQRLVEDKQLTTTVAKGEKPEVDSADVWKSLIERLGKKEYQWDERLYGDLDDYSEKVAYFFHLALQGVAPAAGAREALTHIVQGGFIQGMCADGQAFSLVQLVRALREQGPMNNWTDVLTPTCVALSYQVGPRQPSHELVKRTVDQFRRQGISPPEILFVASRLQEELVPAKKLGLRTALYAGDKHSLQARSADLKDPQIKPDRLLTELTQIRQILT